MNASRAVRKAIGITLVSLGCLHTSFPASAQSLALISDEEARLPPAKPQPPSRAITRGPGIRMVSPETPTEPTKSPVAIRIVFEPRGGAKINVDSLRVTYMKFPFVDLTERVKPYVKPTGIEIPSASIPSGEHSIRVVVADEEERQGSAVLTLNVVR